MNQPQVTKPNAVSGKRRPIGSHRAKANKQALMLEAAVNMFMQHGYNVARMDGIGDAAGVSYATLYKYFPKKEVLFEAAVEHLTTQLFDDWKAKQPPFDLEEGLRFMANNYIELVSEPRLVSLVRMVIAQINVFPHLGPKLLIEVRSRFIAVTETWMQMQVERGALRKIDVRYARTEFIAVLAEAFLWPQLFLIQALPTGNEAEVIIEKSVKQFLAHYAVEKYKIPTNGG
jgi:TetR/AcrR family transcriptional regulator, regulator of autoinduction and epiphytic fitness